MTLLSETLASSIKRLISGAATTETERPKRSRRQREIATNLLLRYPDPVLRPSLAKVDRICLPPADDLAGMEDVENDSNNEHQRRIEDVKVDLLGLQLPVPALLVLDDAEDRSHEDDAARRVEDQNEAAPRNRHLKTTSGRPTVDAEVEDGRHDEEKGEEGELDEQADKDDFLRPVELVDRITDADESTSCRIC